MPSNSASDQTRILAEAKAWLLRQRGWTQARIAGEIGLDQGTVCRMLDRIERRECARLARKVAGHKGRQNAILEHLVDESFQAWEASKKPQKRASRKTSMGVSVETTDILEREGEVAYLDRVLAALKDQRFLWGLNEAPKRASDEGGGLTLSALAARLAANGAAHDADASEPEPEDETGPA